MLIYKKLLPNGQKSYFATGKHGIGRGVLSQCRGRVLKHFPGGFTPRPPRFNTFQFTPLSLLSTTHSIYAQSVRQNFRSRAWLHPPNKIWMCAPVYWDVDPLPCYCCDRRIFLGLSRHWLDVWTNTQIHLILSFVFYRGSLIICQNV